MKKLRVAPLAAVVAAALLSTTGYCAFNPQTEPPITAYPAVSPPVSLLPQAIIPYPPTDPE